MFVPLDGWNAKPTPKDRFKCVGCGAEVLVVDGDTEHFEAFSEVTRKQVEMTVCTRCLG